jgi:hypothetical protein
MTGPMASDDPDAPINQLPLVQDGLLWSVPGWYFEHGLNGSTAERGDRVLTITALESDFELVLSAPGEPEVREHAGPSAADVLRAIERLVADGPSPAAP